MSKTALAVLLLSAAFVFSVFVRDPGINDYEKARFGDMVYGRAHRPFVFRTLLPSTVRAVASAVPEGARDGLRDSLADTAFFDRVFSRFRWEKEYFTEYLVASLLMYLSLAGFGLAVRYLLDGLYEAPRLLREAMPALSVLLLLPFFSRNSYLYDFPALALFTLGAGLMARGRWKAYMAVFVLACLNKETAVLLTMVHAVHLLRRDEERRQLHLRLIAVQLAAFAVVKVSLFFAFRDNPGSLVEFHLIDHNIDIVEYTMTGALSLAGAAVAVAWRWKEKPAFLRDGLWIVVPLVVLTGLFGFVDELRDYYEAYPLVLLLLADSAVRVLGLPLTVRKRPA